MHDWLPGLVLRGARWCVLLRAVMLTRPCFSARMAVAATAAALPCAPWRLGTRPSRTLIRPQRHGAERRELRLLLTDGLTHSLTPRSPVCAHSSTVEAGNHFLPHCGVTASAGRSAPSLVPVRLYRAPEWAQGGEHALSMSSVDVGTARRLQQGSTTRRRVLQASTPRSPDGLSSHFPNPEPFAPHVILRLYRARTISDNERARVEPPCPLFVGRIREK